MTKGEGQEGRGERAGMTGGKGRKDGGKGQE